MKITSITRQPFWLNKKNMADSLGISVQAFDKWGVEAVAKIGRETFYDAKSVVENRLKHQSVKQQPGLDEVDPLIAYKIDCERLRLTKEQADAAARRNKVGDKELVPVGFMIFALSKLSAKLASALDVIPKTVKRANPDISPRHLEAFETEIVVTRNDAAALADQIPELLDEYIATLDEASG